MTNHLSDFIEKIKIKKIKPKDTEEMKPLYKRDRTRFTNKYEV